MYDWVYDRGLEDEDWVHDRWGDDDDDDWDDYGDEPEKKVVKVKEEKDVADERKFFGNAERFEEEYDKYNRHEEKPKRGTRESVILHFLERPDLMKIDSVDGNLYDLDVYQDVVDMANAFDIQLDWPPKYDENGRERKARLWNNLTDAVASFHRNNDIIKGELTEKIKKWFGEADNLNAGHLSFAGCCSDTVTLDRMGECLRWFYKVGTFCEFRNFCHNRVLHGMDLDLWEKDVAEMAAWLEGEKANGHYKSGWHWGSYEKEKEERFHKSVAKLAFVKSAHCFTQDTFARLYVLLEEREKQEAVINRIAKKHGWKKENG